MRCGVAISPSMLDGPHASQWCNTGCHGPSWSRPQRRGCNVLVSASSCCHHNDWSIACSIWTPLAPLAWSVVRSASQLATYLLKCIHKLNWGNSTHNNSRSSPLWPATGPGPSHWMFAGDGWLQSSLYHRIWAGLPPAPGITPSHMTPSLHPIPCIGVTFPEAALATDICTCPTCPPANAHNWLWWKGAWQNYPEITGQFRLHAALRQPHLFWVIIMRGMKWSFFEQIAKKS